METIKNYLTNIASVLSRAEMRQIKAGGHCSPPFAQCNCYDSSGGALGHVCCTMDWCDNIQCCQAQFSNATSIDCGCHC